MQPIFPHNVFAGWMDTCKFPSPFWKWMKQSLQMTPSKNYLFFLWLAQHWQYWDLGSPPIRWPPTINSTSKSPQQLSMNTRHKTKWEIFFKERLHSTVNGKCKKILHPFPLSPYLISRQTFPTLWSQIFESDFEQIWISILRASQKHNVFKAGLMNFCVVGKSSEYNPVESRLLDNNWTSWQSVIGKPATYSRLNLNFFNIPKSLSFE